MQPSKGEAWHCQEECNNHFLIMQKERGVVGWLLVKVLSIFCIWWHNDNGEEIMPWPCCLLLLCRKLLALNCENPVKTWVRIVACWSFGRFSFQKHSYSSWDTTTTTTKRCVKTLWKPEFVLLRAGVLRGFHFKKHTHSWDTTTTKRSCIHKWKTPPNNLLKWLGSTCNQARRRYDNAKKNATSISSSCKKREV